MFDILDYFTFFGVAFAVGIKEVLDSKLRLTFYTTISNRSPPITGRDNLSSTPRSLPRSYTLPMVSQGDEMETE